MKKIITLFTAIAAFVAVHAQTSRDEARKVVLGQEKNKGTSSQEGRDIILGGGNRNDYPTYPGSYPTSRQSQIDQVNREYDAKVWSIRNNRTLSQVEKDRMIRQLEEDRARRIRELNQSNGYGKKKGDNGKHLGWEKGKGNPHKYGREGKKNKKGDRDDD